MTTNAHVEQLIQKAAAAEKADEAMKFAQAACNAANALVALSNIKK
jgi:hypothetical protein